MKVTLDCIYDVFPLKYTFTLIEYQGQYWWCTPFYSQLHPYLNPAIKFKDSLRSVSTHNDSLWLIFSFIEDDLLSLGQPLHLSIETDEEDVCRSIMISESP